MPSDSQEAIRERVSYVLSVAEASRYKPLPREISLAVRSIYKAQLPRILQEEEHLSIFSPQGSLLATGYNRVVIGDYGAYIEFLPEQIVRDNIRPRWKTVTDKPVKYIWWEPVDGSSVKLYEQQDTVGYADYRIGCWYVAPSEVVLV